MLYKKYQKDAWDALLKYCFRFGQQCHPWVVWFITLLFTVLQFLSQLTTGVMAGSFAHTFKLNSLSLGLLVAAYYFIYVPMQGPAGMLLDRFGPRLLLAVGALVFSLGSIILAVSPVLWLAIIARMIMGLGASCAFIGCINTATRWFPRNLVIRLTSVLELVGITAVLIGNHYIPYGLSYFGWRSLMMVAAGVAAMMGIVIWAIVRNESPYAKRLKPAKSSHSQNVIRRMGWIKCLLSISRRSSMWINGFYCGILFSFVSVFSALWGILYLQKAKGISLTTASHVNNFLLLGVLVGCFVMIFIQKLIKNDIRVMRNTAFAMGVISFSVLFYVYMPSWLIELSLFLLGILSPVYLLNFKICALLLPDSLRASSTGFTNMMMMAIAPIFQLVFAGIVMIAVHYMPYLEAEQIGMALFPALIFTAAILICRIKIPKNRPIR
jgi:MFS family permease